MERLSKKTFIDNLRDAGKMLRNANQILAETKHVFDEASKLVDHTTRLFSPHAYRVK